MKWPRVLKLMVLGAVGFWLPDTVLHAFRGHDFNARDVAIVTAMTPLTLLITFLLGRWADKGALQKQVGPSLVAGVWFFGGLFMIVGASFSGGGFLSPVGVREVVMLTLASFVPVVTFALATYDGALGALLLVTAVAFIVWIVQRSGIFLRFSRKAGIHKSP